MKKEKINISWRRFSAKLENVSKRGIIVIVIICSTILLLPIITAVCISIIY